MERHTPAAQLRGIEQAGTLFYYGTDTLAGHKKPVPKGSVIEHYRSLIPQAKNSAQDVKFPIKHPLPWEFDKEGKFFSAPGEADSYLAGEIKKILGLDACSKPEDYKSVHHLNAAVPAPLQAALCNKLVELECNNWVSMVEKDFKMGLLDWMLGQGPVDEYARCFWITPEEKAEYKEEIKKLRDPHWLEPSGKDKKNRKEVVLQAFQKAYLQAGGDAQEIWKSPLEMQFKAKAFKDELQRTVPKTKEEFYLWYKYLVKGKDINFDYLFVPSYMQWLHDSQNSHWEREKGTMYADDLEDINEFSRAMKLEDLPEEEKKEEIKKALFGTDKGHLILAKRLQKLKDAVDAGDPDLNKRLVATEKVFGEYGFEPLPSAGAITATGRINHLVTWVDTTARGYRAKAVPVRVRTPTKSTVKRTPKKTPAPTPSAIPFTPARGSPDTSTVPPVSPSTPLRTPPRALSMEDETTSTEAETLMAMSDIERENRALAKEKEMEERSKVLSELEHALPEIVNDLSMEELGGIFGKEKLHARQISLRKLVEERSRVAALNKLKIGADNKVDLMKRAIVADEKLANNALIEAINRKTRNISAMAYNAAKPMPAAHPSAKLKAATKAPPPAKAAKPPAPAPAMLDVLEGGLGAVHTPVKPVLPPPPIARSPEQRLAQVQEYERSYPTLSKIIDDIAQDSSASKAADLDEFIEKTWEIKGPLRKELKSIRAEALEDWVRSLRLQRKKMEGIEGKK
jgi:hypothetical protein